MGGREGIRGVWILVAVVGVLLRATAWVRPPPLPTAARQAWAACSSLRGLDGGARQQDTVASYRQRLMECARSGSVDAADEIWRLMLQDDLTPDKESLELLLLTNLKVSSGNLQLDDCESIFSEIIKAHSSPSQKIVLALFRAFGRAKQLDRIERLYDRISFLSPDILTIEVYNAIILAWARSDSEMATRKTQEWLDRLRFDGREPNVDTYSAIIDGWAGSGKSNAATEAGNVLWTMRQEGMRPGPRQYESVLALWAGSREPDAAARMHALADEMKADGMVLSQACYDCIISAYSQDTMGGESREAVPAAVQAVIVEMDQVGLDTANAQMALVAAFVRSRLPGSATKADAALAHMETTGQQPTANLFMLVIEAYRKAGDPVKAEAVLDRFVAAHLEPASSSTVVDLNTQLAAPAAQQQRAQEHSARTDTRPWVGVIRAYDRGSVRITKPKARKPSAANALRHSNGTDSPKSDLASRSLDGPVSLEVFFSRGADDAHRVFQKMLRCGVEPDLATYSTLISIWAKLGEVDRVEALMADMSRRGVAPASTSYLSLLQCWLNRLSGATAADMQAHAAAQVEAVFARMCGEPTRELEYCQEAFQSVLRAGFSPRLETMKTFLRLFVASVDEEERCAMPVAIAAATARMNGAPGASSGARLLATLQVSSSPADSAVAVINKMVQAGVEPDIECYTLLIGALEAAARTPRWSRANIPDQALELVKSLLASRLTPSQEIYERLLRIWAKSRRSDAPRVADSIFRSCVGRLGSPSPECFSLLMEAWAYSPLPNAAEKSEEVFETMKAAGVAPTPRTFYLLARAWAKTSRRRGPFSVLRINGTVRRDNYLSRVEDVYRRSLEHGLRPRGKMAHTLVTVWALDGSSESIAQAETFLVDLSMDESAADVTVGAASPSWREPHDAALNALASAWRDPPSSAANFTARLVGQAARGQQLKVAYDLQLAAYGASSALAERHAQAALGLYEKMLHQGQQEEEEEEYPRADVLSLNLLLRCLRLSGSRSALERAHEALDASQQCGIGPSDQTLAVMAAIWKDRSCTDVLSRTQALFNRLAELRRPSHASFALLLELLGDSDPRKSTALLDQMLASDLMPSPSMFAGVMRVWASKERPEMCESVFEKMRAMSIRPDPATCRHLLLALASSGRIDSAERTSAVLQQILDGGTQMDSLMLESVLKAWSKSGSDISPVKVEEVLQLAQASGVALTVYEYNLVLDVFGKSRRAHAAELTEELLGKMSVASVKPDICSYNSVIAAWGRSGHPQAESRAQRVFDAACAEGLQPDIISYSSLVSALSRSNDVQAPHRASVLFDRMLAQHIVPDKISWTILISLWARSELPEKEDKVAATFDRMLHTGCEPNAVTYTVMLKMWATSNSLQAGRKVVELFKHMQQTRVTLDTVGYSSLLSALSQSKEVTAPGKASDVFEQMLAAGVKADTRSWTIIISIWAKSAHPERERRVEGYFERMLEYGSVPNVVTYSVMLRMWTSLAGRVGPQQAKARGCIIDIYERLAQENVAIDGGGFTVLLSALRAALEPAAAVDKAEALLMRMVQFGLFPDPLAWCSVLRADISSCRAFDRAQRLYRAWLQGSPSSRGGASRQGQEEVLPEVLQVLAGCSPENPDVWPLARKVLSDARSFGLPINENMLQAALAVVSGPTGEDLNKEVDELLAMAPAQPTRTVTGGETSRRTVTGGETSRRTVTRLLQALSRADGIDPAAAEERMVKTMAQLGVSEPENASLVVVMELWHRQAHLPKEAVIDNLLRLARRVRGRAAEVDAAWLVLLSSLGSGGLHSRSVEQWRRVASCLGAYLGVLAGRAETVGQDSDAPTTAVVQGVLEVLREAYWAGHAPKAELAALLRATGACLLPFQKSNSWGVDKERFLPMMSAVLDVGPEGSVEACEGLGFTFSQGAGRWRRKK